MPTAKSWISGSRLPAARMQELHDFLRRDAAIILSLQSDLEFQIAVEVRRFKPRRGFFAVKDWDGTGIGTDRQWRGGRPNNWSISVNDRSGSCYLRVF